ncbi:MAG TPA: adenylate/guanylate cyclase domain-containing protein, partial [Steroidobacteraceae bacterium]|nr:adenylate/guanylate cyclase domain-containing protein [Steroidobacteraceae bacterium]
MADRPADLACATYDECASSHESKFVAGQSGQSQLHLQLIGAAFWREAECQITIRRLYACSGCFRLERSPGGPCNFDAHGEFGQTEDRLPRAGLLSSLLLAGSGRMAEERVERRLAAILCTDVVGYSRLMGSDEEKTLAVLKGHRRELIDPLIDQHRGRIFKTTGDGMLIEFASVVD